MTTKITQQFGLAKLASISRCGSQMKIRPSMVVALFLLLAQVSGLLAQNPSCPVPIVPCSGNGQSSKLSLLVGGVPQNDAVVHVGETLFYQVTVGVAADQSCAETDVNAFLGLPDGTVVQFLSRACIAGNGGTITCPGDPACINTNLLNYTVGTVPDDMGKAFSLSVPNELPEGGMNNCFVTPTPQRVGAVLNVVGLAVGPTLVSMVSSCNSITASVIPSQPRFTSSMVVGLDLILGGSDGPAHATYTVLTTTNISMPLWVPVATNTFDIGGHFTFTNHIDPGECQRYFRLRLP